jgi:hypothetical protein
MTGVFMPGIMLHGTRLNYTLVLNQVRGDDFRILDNSGEKERALALGASIITMKRLHEASMIKIDASSMSFWAVTNKSEGDTSGLRLLERQRVKPSRGCDGIFSANSTHN